MTISVMNNAPKFIIINIKKQSRMELFDDDEIHDYDHEQDEVDSSSKRSLSDGSRRSRDRPPIPE